jgi:hypothetical protein
VDFTNVFLLVEYDTVLVIARDVGLEEMVACYGLSQKWYGGEGCYLHSLWSVLKSAKYRF